MKLEFKKFNTRTASVCDHEICMKYGLPEFVYGDLLSLKYEGKAGCLNKSNPKFSIPFKYDYIEVAENGIVMAVYSKESVKVTIDFYDKRGKYLTNYSLNKTDAFYLEQDATTICCLIWEETDEETYEIMRGYMSILSDGKVIHRMLTEEEKKPLWRNTQKAVYTKAYKVESFETKEFVSFDTIERIVKILPNCHFLIKDNHLIMFEDDAYGLALCFGSAEKSQFFKTEQDREAYIKKLEEDILNEIISAVKF